MAAYTEIFSLAVRFMHITSDNVFFFRDQLMQYHSEIELLIFISMLYRHDYLIEEWRINFFKCCHIMNMCMAQGHDDKVTSIA